MQLIFKLFGVEGWQYHLNPFLTKTRHPLEWTFQAHWVIKIILQTMSGTGKTVIVVRVHRVIASKNSWRFQAACLIVNEDVSHPHIMVTFLFTKDVHVHTKSLIIISSQVVEPTLPKLIIYDLNYWKFNYKRMPKVATSGLRWLLSRSSLCQQRGINRFESLVIRGGESGEGSFDCFFDSWNTTDLMESVLGKMVTTHHPWMLKDLKYE